MAGSSALSQLKASLHSTTSSSSAGSKKRSASGAKSRSSVSQAYKSLKNQDISAKLNSFDTLEEKKKFKVVTRGGKLEKGIIKSTPGKSRAAGIELRQRTLLPQLLARNHTSTFIDHRFGESTSSSATLTLEEKALERFTAERTSRLSAADKKARYNLEEGDELGGLTHGGRKLGFGDEDELESGGWGGGAMLDDGGVINSNREPLTGARRMANAGPEMDEDGEPARKRSKAEIMLEVVAKSKAYKHERQKVKSADDDIRHDLDAGLSDLRMLLGGAAAPSKVNSRLGKSPPADNVEASEDEEDSDEDDEDDEDDDEDDGGDGTIELTDKELEEALASRSGVDRDLLRKLIGKLGNDSSDEESAPAPVKTAPAAAQPILALPSQADLYSLSSITDDQRPPFPAPFSTAQITEADPYDSYVKLLALEPRAQASDRLKTSLEVARDEVERLGVLEKKRLRRARGEDSESEDEEQKEKRRKRAPQGDDLDDDFAVDGSDEDGDDQDEGLGAGLTGGFGHQVIKLQDELVLAPPDEDEDEDEEEEEESDDGDDDEDENAMDLADLEGSDDEDTGDVEALVPLDGAGTATTPALKEKRAWTGQVVPSIEALPFTFPCPTGHSEFLRLLGMAGIHPGQGDETSEREGTVLVIKRIRTLYHPGLGAGNKEKLQIFTSVLIDHVLHLSSLPVTTTSSPYRSINALLPHLLTLSHAYPLTTAPLYIGKLALLSKNFIKGISSGALARTSRTWPGLAELNILRLVGMTWSTSDLSHPVAAAALLVIGQYLSPQSRVRSLEDIASGLFLCSIVAQYEQQSKRLVPEVMGFLLQTLGLLLPNPFKNKLAASEGAQGEQKQKKKQSPPQWVPGNFSTPDWGMDHVKGLKLRSTLDFTPASPLALPAALLPAKPSAETQKKVDLASLTFKLLEAFAEMYVPLEAFIEIVAPVQQVLAGVLVAKIPVCTQNEIVALQTNLARMVKLSESSRQPLLLQAHKPIPLATFIPKFDESYNPNRAFDPDTERAESSKLKKLFKQEKKGAIRELHKDNRFLAAEEGKRKKVEGEVYAKKIAKIMGSLGDERAEEKQMEATKARGKRQDKARRK